MVIRRCIFQSIQTSIIKRVLLLVIAIMLNIGHGRFLRLGACFLAPDFFYDCFDIHVIDTLAYLASEDLAIINIAEPDSPFVIGTLDSNTVFRSALKSNYPFAFAMGTGYVGSFDITDPSMPLFLDSIGIQFLYNDLEIKNGYAFVTGNDLHLVDINTPDSLHYITTIDSTALAGRLTRCENYLYELISICSLFVYDISNPSNPQKIGSCPLPTAFGLTSSEPQYRDSIIFYPRVELGFPTLTLNTVDVSNPYNPIFLTSSTSVGTDINSTYDLALSGDFAYVTFNVNSEGNSPIAYQGDEPWISVFDITNPDNLIPVWHNQNYPLSRAIGIDACADTIYLCDGDSFYIYLDTLWTGISENTTNQVCCNYYSCSPNPCHDYTWLISTNKDSELMTISSILVYDIAGRLICEFSPCVKPGTQRILLNSERKGGKQLAEGIYFVECRHKNQSICIIKITKL